MNVLHLPTGFTRLARVGTTACLVGLLIGCASPALHTTSSTQIDNGESVKTGRQVIHDSAAAMRAVTSYRVTGMVPRSDGAPNSMDVEYTRTASSGSIDIAGAKLDEVLLQNKVYIRGRSMFARIGGAAFGDLIGDRWVSFNRDDPTSAPFTYGSDTYSIDGFASVLDRGSYYAAIGPSANVGGQTAIVIDGVSFGGDLRPLVYVASVGPPLVLEVKQSASPPWHVEFSDFNVDFNIVAPTDVVDGTALAKLGQGPKQPGAIPSP